MSVQGDVIAIQITVNILQIALFPFNLKIQYQTQGRNLLSVKLLGTGRN